MKILAPIIIILIAALAVIGAATALMGSSNNADFPDARHEPRPFVQDQPGGVPGGLEGRRSHERFHEGGHDAPSLFGIVGVIQNFVIIGLVVGVVTLGSHLKRGLARLTGSFHNI